MPKEIAHAQAADNGPTPSDLKIASELGRRVARIAGSMVKKG